jgi:hypothetical protein
LRTYRTKLNEYFRSSGFKYSKTLRCWRRGKIEANVSKEGQQDWIIQISYFKDISWTGDADDICITYGKNEDLLLDLFIPSPNTIIPTPIRDRVKNLTTHQFLKYVKMMKIVREIQAIK